MRCLFLYCVLLASSTGYGAEPIVIAHRGASGYLPEHTLAAYERAIDLGADYIEPDLVITKDGVLVARHDNQLSHTTNVVDRAEFASRRKAVDDTVDWFVEDFTLAEMKTLRARQAFAGRTREFDDQLEIPTFQEVIDLVKRKQRETGRTIGLYPETKAPSRFASLGFDFARLLLDALVANGLEGPGARVFIQSFEPEVLRQLNSMTELPLIMLVEPISRDEPHRPNIPLTEVATFADGVGAFKMLLLNEAMESTGFVASAHQLGLLVHVWTFRNDSYPQSVFTSPTDEITRYLDLGIDGFFTDFPDTGVAARDAFSQRMGVSAETAN
jgi:glycerophosphoryl diester phosphodiesterase